MNGDNGQTYQISPKDAQGNFSIKIVDANDREDPKIYDFKFPCQKICSAPYTKVSYSVSGADGDNAPSTQAPTPRDIIQTPPTPPSPQEPQVPSEPRQSAPSQPRPTPELPHEGTNQNGTNDNILSIVYKQQSQWDNGYCVEVEASHSQQKTTKNWSAQFRLPWGNLQNFWNLEITALETGRFKIKPTESWAQTIGPGQRVGGMGFCINGATMGEGTPETNLINVDF